MTTFGPVSEVLGPCQEELSVRQLRRTARAVAFVVPAMIAGWHLVWSADPSISAVAGSISTAPMALTWPVLPLAAVAAALGLALLARSAWACHRCADTQVAV